MGRPLCTIVFIVWAHQCWACEIEQSPSLLVALSKEESTVNCDVKIIPTGSSQDITTSVFFKDKPKKILVEILNTLDNTINRTTVQHNFTIIKSGVYICQVKCGNRHSKGKGTYIHVRDSSYEEPIGPAGRLQCGLIVLLVLMLLLFFSGTYLVLPFHQKKQRKPSKASGLSQGPRGTPKPTMQQSEEETSGSLYTSLQTPSDDVYDVLEEDITKKPNKHLAEIHSVPNRKPKPQVKSPPVPEKPVRGKSPAKQKPKNGPTDTSLYENLKR